MRPLFSSVLILSVLFAPFLFTLALIVFGVLYFPRYFESVVAALIIELLYRDSGSGMLAAAGLFTALIIFFLALCELLRLFIRTKIR